METQLSIALLVCLLHCSFAEVTEGGPDEFCEDGPPGKYCLPDLSGWHNCYVDPSTKKMVDNITSCASNTRCACFYGPPCPGSLENPCQPYRLPPPTPDKFTLYYNTKRTDCSPAGCNDTYTSGREMQSLAEHKKRDDVYGPQYWSGIFVLPGNGSGFTQTDVRWDKEQCTSQQIKFFPETEIPPYFSFNGTVRVGYQLCEQWIWRTGGHNPGQATSVVTYYIANQTNVVRDEDKNTFVPVKVETFFNSGPVNKTTSHMVFNITSFLIGDVDEELLKLPSFCHKEVEA